jgi:hypothetical protein
VEAMEMHLKVDIIKAFAYCKIEKELKEEIIIEENLLHKVKYTFLLKDLIVPTCLDLYHKARPLDSLGFNIGNQYFMKVNLIVFFLMKDFLLKLI